MRSDNRVFDISPLWCRLVVTLLPLAGCQDHRLQGRVLPAPAGALLMVDASDPRLGEMGLGGAILELTIDPACLRPQALGANTSDADGHFDIAIDQLGAGMLKYDLAIHCRHKGYKSLYQVVPLPPSDQRLVIYLEPERDVQPPARDVLEETMELKERLLRE